MKSISSRSRSFPAFWVFLAMSAVILFALVAASPAGGGALASGSGAGAEAPNATCPAGQCFTDVPPGNPFYAFANALYMDDIISGYPCGGANEPCDDESRPYYRPGNSVTRAQMSKFVDNGRRNIVDAVGLSLAMTTTRPAAIRINNSEGTALLVNTVGTGVSISSTTSNAIFAYSASGNDTIHADCTRANTACYAIHAVAATGDYPGYFVGGRGLYSESDDDNHSAVNGVAYGANSPGGEFYSPHYRSLQIDAPPASTGYVQLGVNGVGLTAYAERIFNGGLNVEGNLVVGGSKSGYVVDAMQNAGTDVLEPGDVVEIVGSSAPVIGQIPVVTVRKADTAYSTGVVGVVDQALYVPDAATRATYDKQQQDYRQAIVQRDTLQQQVQAEGAKPDLSRVTMPDMTITDEQGSVHATDATSIPPDGYANVTTLGSYRGVKVDASFGPIHAGDLLVASPHAGYAMKGTDRLLASGATIGKALADLEKGTGLIPVMVTLK